jgi:hypothetical protein
MIFYVHHHENDSVIKQTLEKLWLFNFGFQKSHGNPNFGFDLLTLVWFGFLKTEPTFGLPHIATNKSFVIHETTNVKLFNLTPKCSKIHVAYGHTQVTRDQLCICTIIVMSISLRRRSKFDCNHVVSSSTNRDMHRIQ